MHNMWLFVGKQQMRAVRSFHILSTKPFKRTGVGGGRSLWEWGDNLSCWKRIQVWGRAQAQEERCPAAWVTETWGDVDQSSVMWKNQDKTIENGNERAVEDVTSEVVMFLPFVNCFAEMLYELRFYK